MTALDFYKIFGSLALTIAGALFGYLMKRNTHEVVIEGRVKELEKWKQEAQGCLEKVRARESEDALRQYRQDESDKKLSEISTQISSGFERVSGEINALNLQMVAIVAKGANTESSLIKESVRIDNVEKKLADLQIAVEGIGADLRAVRYKEDDP